MINIKETKFSKISNIIFLTTTTFIISFIWINFYIKNTKYSLISSTIIALCFFTLYLVIKYYKNKIYLKAENTSKQLESLKVYLLYGSYTNIIETISKAFNLTNLSITDNNKHYIDNDNNKDIFLFFDKEIIDEEEFISSQKNKVNNNIEIYCIDNIPSFNTIENVNINIITIKQIHQKLLEKNIIPDQNIKLKKTTKFKLKEALSIILNKAKSKTYFIWGLILIFLSLFTIYYVYYNIIGSLLLLLSVYSRFNKRFN